MIKLLLLTTLIIFFTTGCATVGPTVRIETPEPSDDIVVACSWGQTPLLAFHGGGRQSHKSAYIISSGETIDCGLAIGDYSSVEVMHPIYVQPEIIKQKDVTVYKYTKTRLDILDELKNKYGKHIGNEIDRAGVIYAQSIRGVCGFPVRYLKTYGSVVKLNREYFYKKYNHKLTLCLERTTPIIKKYLSYSYRGKVAPTTQEKIDRFWASPIWNNE